MGLDALGDDIRAGHVSSFLGCLDDGASHRLAEGRCADANLPQSLRAAIRNIPARWSHGVLARMYAVAR